MKSILFVITFLSLSVNIIAQQWVIENTDLIATRKNGKISLSFYDNRDSLIFDADTLFFSFETGCIFVQSGALYGIIDPSGLHWIHKPESTSLEFISDQFLLVKDNDKHYFYVLDGSGLNTNFIYDAISPFTPPGEPVYNGMHVYLTRIGNKYGLLVEWGDLYEMVPVKYDEIVFILSHDSGIVYKIRKGKKWGAGDCEGIEIPVKFDDIEYMTGSCANNYFKAKQKNKYGLVSTSRSGKAIYPFHFDSIEFIGDYIGNGYFILRSDNKLDVVEDTFPPFTGKYDRVWIEKRDGNTVINMESKGEKTSITIE